MAGNISSSLLSTSLRGMAGINSMAAKIKPVKVLQLYDIENCPYCRLAREAFTELDLDVHIIPCPKSGQRFRPELKKRGGKAQFPYLIDPNTGVEMYESLDIVAYLYETYGQRPVPLKWRLGPVQTFSSMLASAARLGRGMQVRSGHPPEKLLELYSFESSPFARPVRELLCELELPYILRSCGRSDWQEWILPPLRKALGVTPASTLKNRLHLQQREGKVSIPYLFDPNTDTGLFECADILDYLQVTYGS
ncbi:MAG: glutathione S-transferase [Halieaceae bacterium]|jgi:glutaredoxin|nr:glutathione S-transferase [Halieaceae bacterium]